MPKKPDRNLIVSLDVGTSKVVAMVAEINAEGQLEVIGMGSHPSRGLKKGVVVNIDATVQSMQKALEETELMTGCQIHSVFVGIAGSHIRSFNSDGIVAIRDQEVTQYDVERVIEAAKAVAIPADQKTLHILPQEFTIDHQESVRDPIGMSGVRLEAKVHMVTGSVTADSNIVKCVRRCGLDVNDIILEQLASSHAVLTEDEKQLGVCLVDIGGGTTDIAIYTDGAIRHTAVIPIAGDQVTNDIAMALRTPIQSAENIKVQYGCAWTKIANNDDLLEIPMVGDRAAKRLSKVALAEVIEPRFEELFNLIQDQCRRCGVEDLLGSGIVLTGGSARIHGIVELAEEVFQLPVRLGVPRNIAGVLVEELKNPMYATSVGLLIHGYQSQHAARAELISNQGFKGMFTRMKSWFQGNF